VGILVCHPLSSIQIHPSNNDQFSGLLMAMVDNYHAAHASYQARLEEGRNKRDLEMSNAKEKRENEEILNRKQEEEMAARKKIELRESELFEKEKHVRIDMDAANVLIKEFLPSSSLA
jgi:cell shape-determining protein MreC